jgi:hypothetical protein
MYRLLLFIIIVVVVYQYFLPGFGLLLSSVAHGNVRNRSQIASFLGEWARESGLMIHERTGFVVAICTKPPRVAGSIVRIDFK